MRNITKIILHCSATPEGRDVKMETIRDWHVKDNKWRDIGYHYVIELDGGVRTGRRLTLAGAHTVGHNINSIGICYVGGMTKDMKKAKDTRTEAQKESMRVLVAEMKKKYPLATVHGHNEFANKACPSFDVSKEGY